MTAELQNTEIYAGNDRTLEIPVKNPDGSAKDITGASIAWVMKKHPWSTSNVLSKATGGSGITILDAANGLFEIAITNSDTAALLDALNAEGDLYWHAAEVTDGAGLVCTVTTGYITLKRAGL